MNLESDIMGADQAPPEPLSSDTLIRLQKGFSRILWSIPLGLLLFVGVIRVHWPPFVRLPPYIVAVALLGWGLAALFSASLPRCAWRQGLRTGSGLVFLLFYFAPFLHWWAANPHSDHLTVNMLALVMTSAAVLYVVNMLVSEAAVALGLPMMQIEARLCAFGTLAFYALPMLGWIGYAGYHAWRHNWPLAAVLEGLYHLPLFRILLVLAMIPLALTLTMCGKACLVAEKQLAQATTSETAFPSDRPIASHARKVPS